MDDRDPAIEVGLLCDLARFEHGRGDGGVARRLALDAAAIARSQGDPVLLGYAGVAYQGELAMWARPSDEVGVALLQEALDAMPEAESARAAVAATLADAVILSPGATGLAAADEAIAAARAAGNEGALQRALIARAWSVRGTLPAPERVAAAEEAIELARRRGDPAAESAAGYLLGGAVLSLPDIAAGLETFESLHWGGALERWPAVGSQAALAAAQGRFEEAEELWPAPTCSARRSATPTTPSGPVRRSSSRSRWVISRPLATGTPRRWRQSSAAPCPTRRSSRRWTRPRPQRTRSGVGCSMSTRPWPP